MDVRTTTHHRIAEAPTAGPGSPWLEAAGRLLSAARRWSRLIGAVAKSHGLRDSELIALWAVADLQDADKGSGPSQTELARRLAWSSAQISELIERLRSKGLIAACPGVADRRMRCWTLTPGGRRALSAMIPDLEAAFRSAIPNVDPDGARVAFSQISSAARRHWPREGAA